MHAIPSWIIYTIGFAAQFFFTCRTLLQWLMSEKAKKVSSPVAYWGFSVIAAYLMFVYGVLRDDFSIILGQFISYYVYLWNLRVKGLWTDLSKRGAWKRFAVVLRVVLAVTPLIAAGMLMKNAQAFVQNFFRNDGIPFWLVLFGSAGQIIFTLRFVYQWAVSKHRNESVLPPTFWIISLVGSGVIIAYGIFRKDPVLILGQSFGFVAYIRNLMIGFGNKSEKNDKDS